MTTWDDLLDSTTVAIGAAAVRDGLADATTARVDTPVGPLLVVEHAGAIVRVAFDVEDHDRVLADLAGSIGPRIVPATTPALAAAREQLDDYFAGARSTFDVLVDLRFARGPFRREVLEHLRTIPAGDTRTYAEVAAATGRPRAVRAVGSGCATNPVPVLVPCHRVLRSDGALGGYLGGEQRKRWLLDHERRLAG